MSTKPGARAHLNYLRYVLRHKWFVLLAGLRLGVPLWRLIVHDWTKFTPAEWSPYVAYFWGPKIDGQHPPGVKDAFKEAWRHHWRHNSHHPEHWQDVRDDGSITAREMPLDDTREMIADWVGAGLAQGKPDTHAWYEANRGRLILHSWTRMRVERYLARLKKRA